VGGLRDTIIPWPHSEATGFMFRNSTPADLLEPVLQAVALWENNPDAWRAMTHRAMAKDFSWQKSAASYIDIYRELGFSGAGARYSGEQ
jgi:starch synthase